jgi:general secretion pathway protein G
MKPAPIFTSVVFLTTLVSCAKLSSDAKDSEARAIVTNSARNALVAFKIQMGDYPTTEEGLVALVERPERRKDRWQGPYLKSTEALVDPWGRPYQYRSPAVKSTAGYDLRSLGPDGVLSKDDIANWD